MVSMKTIKIIGSIPLFFINFLLIGDPVILFTLKPYPVIPSNRYCHRIIQQGRTSQACATGMFPSHAPTGIFATYAGYLTISDSIGEIEFPYKQTKPIVNILVT